jgi:hypothetical protein
MPDGQDTFDALHLGCAERSGAVFLTAGDILIKIIKKHADKIPLGIKNPVQSACRSFSFKSPHNL